MTRLAHLTDPHLDGSQARYERLVQALAGASRRGAEHLVLTGDLTKQGKVEQFEQLAMALRPWPTSSVTVVPGNHDGAGSWPGALRATGLRRFAQHCCVGGAVERSDVVVAAVDSTLARRALVFRALGRLGSAQLQWLDALGDRTDKCIVVAMHHGPWHGRLFWFDALTDRDAVWRLLERHPHLHVCCGHHHRIINMGRVFGAGSVVNHPEPLRLYEVIGRKLVPTYQSTQAVGAAVW